MTEKKSSVSSKVTVEDLLKEADIPVKLYIDQDRFIEYLMPSEAESQKLDAEARQATDIESEGRRLEGKKPFTQEEYSARMREVGRDKKLYFGLRKANPDLTPEKWGKLPSGVLDRLRIEFNTLGFKDMSEEQMLELKNLSQMMKGLA
jgi:hypothetical protein